MDEVLPKEEYLNLKTAYDDKNRQCQIEMKKLRKEVKKECTIMEEKKKWLKEMVQNGIIGQQLGEGLLHQLIERIEIDPKEKIVIHFRFNNPRSSDGGKKRNVSDGCVL